MSEQAGVKVPIDRLRESAPATPEVSTAKLVIEPGMTAKNYWRDLWHYRELFGILAWRDVAVRYKQTVVGVAWALVRPFMTMVVFSLLFGRVAKLPSVGAPYPIMVFAGLLPWFLFSSILSEASNSLIANTNLVSKVYFPRIIIPSATVIVALVDLAINLVMLAGLMAWFGFVPSWRVLLLPIFVLFASVASLGPALWLTALNVKYRDFRYIIPFIVQFGLYISPVGFSSAVVPEKWRIFYYLNPVVGPIDGFRWCLLQAGTPLNQQELLISLGVNAMLLILGISYFRATERGFADVI